MGWVLQQPDSGVNPLIDALSAASKGAVQAFGAFAFASATGVKTLTTDHNFEVLLSSGPVDLVIGIDAITDTAALHAFRDLGAKFAGVEISIYLHKKPGSIFHPKIIAFIYADGTGVACVGSGNLTQGGLRSNWEAFSLIQLDQAAVTALEKDWAAWKGGANGRLRSIDDGEVVAIAEKNKRTRQKLKRLADISSEDDSAIDEIVAELKHELGLNRILIAEVPKNERRWGQVGFDKATYQGYFGVDIETGKVITLYPVDDQGKTGAAEKTQAVSVKSKNYRFEIRAASGTYPSEAPILIFESTSDDEFRYMLLMPGSDGHTRTRDWLNAGHPKGRAMRRVETTPHVLSQIWPLCPLL